MRQAAKFRVRVMAANTEHPEPGCNGGPAGRDDAARGGARHFQARQGQRRGQRGAAQGHGHRRRRLRAQDYLQAAEEGDHGRLSQLARRQPPRGPQARHCFYELKIETVVDDKAICTSACALAFLGGRDVNGNVKRTKVSTGRVGFHSFTRDFNDNVTYSAGDLKIVLQRTQTEVFNIAEYLRGIETNMDVLRIMLGAPSSAMNFISNDTAIELGIRSGTRSSTSRSIRLRCSSGSPRRAPRRRSRRRSRRPRPRRLRCPQGPMAVRRRSSRPPPWCRLLRPRRRRSGDADRQVRQRGAGGVSQSSRQLR